MIGMHSTLSMTKNGLNFGLVKTYVTHYHTYLINNIYIRFGIKLRRQILGIPMGTNCAPIVADQICCFVLL